MPFRGSMRLPGWESTAGNKSRARKIDEDAVRDIRTCELEMEEYAEKYGIAVSFVRSLQSWPRRTWKGVEPKALAS